MHFTKLKLVGFKSFIEPSELVIGPGTTGIVGPNGCGKSNLVEAMRWVMGETAPRHVRGSGMEDVIFNGTETRASRNVATWSMLTPRWSTRARYANSPGLPISSLIYIIQ